MKKIALVFLTLLFFQRSFAQQTFDGTSDYLIIVSGGIHQSIISNPAFNAWTASNYNLRTRDFLAGEAEITFTIKNYAIGGYFSGNNPYGFGGGFFGRKITPPASNIASWLDIDAGNFFAFFHNIAPLNYKPTPDQAGQKLELHYYATYIGLTSRNYLIKDVIRVGKRGGIAFIPSFHFSVEYEPFNNTNWKYGYYYTDPSDTSRHFKGVTIKSIPKLNKLYLDAGIAMGFAFKQN